jgi:magnesium transporter
MENRIFSKIAEAMMVRNVPTINEDATIADIENLLLKESKNFISINYVYVLNDTGYLRGVISLREIFRSNKETAVKNLLPDKLISVKPHTHQEKVARLALAHNIKAVPVVDKDNKFLGVVASDAIMDILAREGVEDILKFGGVSPDASIDNVLSLSLFSSLMHRLPWLILGLLGGIIAARVVGLYEEVLSKNLILAAFIPLIVYMADAVGTQMEAFIIRDFALNTKFNFLKYFIRQSSVVILLALTVSSLLYGLSVLLNNGLDISLVLSLSLFFAILTSLLTGLIVPYLFGRMNFDPANASGPIATIVQDSISVFIYFYIATMVL